MAKHYKLHINAKKISKEEVGKVKIHGKDDDDDLEVRMDIFVRSFLIEILILPA